MASTSLEPDEIRIIREGLGLSQREAGQVLGGGPNAFAKYESGSLAPAAALANLLLVLKDNPGALGALQPDRAPVPVRRSLPFEVTGQHIGRISKQALPDLLRLLLQAEALSQGIPLHGIHVADNVDAPDGGEDGRIQWEGGPEQTQFLPARLVQFQLKTGNISPAAAGREVLSKIDEIKPMVRSAFEAGATYMVLSTHAYTQQQLEAREKRVRDTLRGAGLAVEDARVQFRDASQLASWVNTHPAVATWLLEKTEPGLPGPFRSWSHWAGRSESASPWVEDKRLKPLCQFLHQRAINKPRSIARIVGLWGIGKSRLALEAFHPTQSDLNLSSLILYAVETDAGSVAIKTTVQRLADSGVRAVVVVDQCPPETHRAIAGMVERETSQLSLLTLEDEIPGGTLNESTYRVEEAPDAVTDAVINRVAPGLQGGDQRRLARFSRGFPKLSILIVQAWQGSIPLGHATDNHLVEAYILGRNPQERDLILKSARLLATFGLVGIDTDHQGDNQVDRIARLGRNLSSQDLRAGARMLAERGVARRWGRYVSLEPLPIVMKLAEQQWKEWDKDQWETVLTDGAPDAMIRTGELRLNAQAAKHLKFLNQPPLTIAQEVVKHVCRYGGPFEGQQGILAPGHAEALSHLAEIDTGAVADQITRSLDGVEDLVSIARYARRHLVWALEKIAFPSDTFEKGAQLLLRLAAAENEKCVNNATGQFMALFPLYLAGTEADGTQRLSLLDNLSKTNDIREKKVLIKALAEGLRLHSLRRVLGPEAYGALPALRSWQPGTAEERDSYICGCATRLTRFAVMDDVTGALGRTALGEQLGSLVRHGFIKMIEESIVNQVGDTVTHWPEALNSLSRYSSYQSANAPDDLIDRVQKLIRKLEPQSLEAQLRFLINEMPQDYLAVKEDNHDYKKTTQRQANVVRALAAEAMQQPETLRSLLPKLGCGQRWTTNVFGQALAEECTDSWSEWLELLIQAFEESSETERRYNLFMGYIIGLANHQPAAVEAFKKRAARSPALAPTLPMICASIGYTLSDLDLIISALQNRLLLPRWLHCTIIDRVLHNVSPQAAAQLIDMLIEHSGEGFANALHLLGMYIHEDCERLETFRPQIRKIAENIIHWPWNVQANDLNSETMMKYEFEEIITWILEKGPDDRDAVTTAMILAKAVAGIVAIDYDYNRQEALRSVLPILLSRFPGIAWPLIGSAIISTKRIYYFENFIGHELKWDHEMRSPLLSLPEDTLFSWCHAHSEQAPAFVAKTVPFLASDDSGTGTFSVHPVMVRLLEEFGDCKDVTEAIDSSVCTEGWSGSVGAIHEIGPEEAFYTKYRKPVQHLLEHPNKKVRRWAKPMLRKIEERVRQARNNDDEFKARFQW